MQVFALGGLPQRAQWPLALLESRVCVPPCKCFFRKDMYLIKNVCSPTNHATFRRRRSRLTLRAWTAPGLTAWTAQALTSVYPPTLSAFWNLPDYSLDITLVFPSLSFSHYCPYDVLRQPDFVNQMAYYTFSFSRRLGGSLRRLGGVTTKRKYV